MNQQSTPNGLYLGFGQNAHQTKKSESSQDNVGAVPSGGNMGANNSEELSSEPWPPCYPDKSWEEIIPLSGKEIGSGSLGSVVQWQGWALKTNAYQHEYDMTVKAGDCAVKPVGRAMTKIQGRPVMKALLMELATPFDVTKVIAAERSAVKREMIRLVCRLHEEYKMVHGDIKPSNFLRCQDGSLRLCDFDSARLMDDDVNEWEGLVTSEFLAPSRNYFETGQAPMPVDDIYALGLSIWSLYTGKEVLKDMDMEELLKDGRTVDLEEIEDMETRWFMRICLRSGGAQVRGR